MNCKFGIFSNNSLKKQSFGRTQLVHFIPRITMVHKRVSVTTSNKPVIFHTVWLLLAIAVMEGNGEMSNEVDSDMVGGMSLGISGDENNMNLGQDAVGNNTVTAVQPGDSTRLACPIPAEMFGTKVSWIRRGDLQLLAVGDNTYTQDHRLFVSHSRHSHNSHHSQVWFLHLRNVTKRDEGEYECQTSTHPHVSIFTFLKVQNAYSRVEGPEERVVAAGSGLRLVCIIEGASSPPSYVFWYHYERMVNYDDTRGISVTKSSPMRSTLVIAEATADHAGNYTCQPSNAFSASVNVHVVAETTEPSATGRVGKKVAEKTPVRQLGVKSASSGGPPIVPPTIPMTLLGLLVLHVLMVPSLLASSTQLINSVSIKFQETFGISKITKSPGNMKFQTFIDSKGRELPKSQRESCGNEVPVPNGLPE